MASGSTHAQTNHQYLIIARIKKNERSGMDDVRSPRRIPLSPVNVAAKGLGVAARRVPCANDENGKANHKGLFKMTLSTPKKSAAKKTPSVVDRAARAEAMGDFQEAKRALCDNAAGSAADRVGAISALRNRLAKQAALRGGQTPKGREAGEVVRQLDQVLDDMAHNEDGATDASPEPESPPIFRKSFRAAVLGWKTPHPANRAPPTCGRGHAMGSAQTFAVVRASRTQQELLGTTKVATPVRRSCRKRTPAQSRCVMADPTPVAEQKPPPAEQRPSDGSDHAAKTAEEAQPAALGACDFAYTPNKFLAPTTKRLSFGASLSPPSEAEASEADAPAPSPSPSPSPVVTDVATAAGTGVGKEEGVADFDFGRTVGVPATDGAAVNADGAVGAAACDATTPTLITTAPSEVTTPKTMVAKVLATIMNASLETEAAQPTVVTIDPKQVAAGMSPVVAGGHGKQHRKEQGEGEQKGEIEGEVGEAPADVASAEGSAQPETPVVDEGDVGSALEASFATTLAPARTIGVDGSIDHVAPAAMGAAMGAAQGTPTPALAPPAPMEDAAAFHSGLTPAKAAAPPPPKPTEEAEELVQESDILGTEPAVEEEANVAEETKEDKEDVVLAVVAPEAARAKRASMRERTTRKKSVSFDDTNIAQTSTRVTTRTTRSKAAAADTAGGKGAAGAPSVRRSSRLAKKSTEEAPAPTPAQKKITRRTTRQGAKAAAAAPAEAEAPARATRRSARHKK